MSVNRTLFLLLVSVSMAVSSVSVAQTVTDYTYDVHGRLVEVQPTAGEVHDYTYDDVHNLLEVGVIQTGGNSAPVCSTVVKTAYAPGFAVPQLESCTDPDGDPLTVTSVTQPSGPASVSLQTGYPNNTPYLVFQNLQCNQTVSVVRTVSDGQTQTTSLVYVISNFPYYMC